MTIYYIKAPGGIAGAGTYRGRHVVSTTWAVGDRVVPTNAYGTAAAKGYVYECTTAGAGGGTQPTWVFTTPDTSTTTDGAAVFTCRNPTTWANASPVPEHVITNRSAAGDIFYQENVFFTETTTQAITFNGTVTNPNFWISTSDTTTNPPTSIATGAGVDLSASSALTLGVSGRARIYGVTLKSSGSTTTGDINVGSASGSVLNLEACSFLLVNSNSSSQVTLGSANAWHPIAIATIGCTFSIGLSAVQTVEPHCVWKSYGDTCLVNTNQPQRYFGTASIGTPCTATMIGADLSAVTTTLVDLSQNGEVFTFDRCRFATGVAVIGNSSSLGNGEVFVYDCSSGDNHYEFGHYNHLGNTTISTAIYVTADGASYDGANKHSWKITGINGSYATPYTSPPIPVYNAGLTAKTPYLEVLRDGSATAYNDDQIWSEWCVKTTANSTIATFNNSDRRTLLASAAAQTASALTTADWTGDTTAWFGKLSPTASVTPAEIGDVSVTVSVAGAITLYVDPQIRGL